MPRTEPTAEQVDAPPTPPTEAEYAFWVNTRVGWFHRAIRILTGWFWNHGYQLRAYGQEHIPPTGAFLMVPNHSSYTDPFVQVKGQARVVRFMAKSTLFHNPLARSVIRAGGGFPVRRGRGDVFAMELARRMLLDGQAVVMYPEGTRFRKSAPLGQPRRGAARLVLELGVPVVPVATWGNKQREVYGRAWWRRPRVTTIYGPLMRFTAGEATPERVDQVRDEIWAEVERLYDIAREVGSRPRRPRRFSVPAADD
ncbi:MAG: 1-acylglycerol-3-phosphate O-acyltransferase [Thermoleophilia bacterium]|nr:1-acylglycerol-3-phosphate O-acyltransferase [Thermoleophilia bacterium]